MEERAGDEMEQSNADSPPASDQQGAGGRRPPPRRAGLLLLLLVAVALFSGTWPRPDTAPDRRYDPHVQQVPASPEPVRATGVLAEVFDLARAATLRIESRCANPLLASVPIDVGSGFFVSASGEVLTAYHVVQRQETSSPARCRLRYVGVDQAGREHRLELVGFDAYADLALLQAATAGEVPFLQMTRDAGRVGQSVVVVGNSRGEFLADRTGRITRTGVRPSQASFASGTLELTASLAPGDSGGPVVSEDGAALGVVSYISYAPSALGSDGDGPLSGLFPRRAPEGFASYAVPVTVESPVVAALRAGERRDVPVIGFAAAFDYDPAARNVPELGRRAGVVVGSVQPGGPAERAGLRRMRETRQQQPAAGRAEIASADVIVALDGRPTPTFDRLLELVRQRAIGDEVTLTVQRDAETVELQLVLEPYRSVFR